MPRGCCSCPYLTGERLAEHTNSRAQFFGLQRKHRQPHLYRAVLEGVALASLRRLQAARAPRTGAGGNDRLLRRRRSPLWLQIKASVYNLPLLQTRNQENGTTGCAIVAGSASGCSAVLPCGVSCTVSIGANSAPIRASTNTTCAASSCSNSSTARRNPSTNSLTLLARSLLG
ncbi:FGGY-family carbohydrate kinase [Serratia ureilytica]